MTEVFRSYPHIRTIDERLNEVARLHKPVIEWVVPIECLDGECDHEDCPRAEIAMTVCQHCQTIREDENDECLRRPWPCQTAKAGGFDTLTAETAPKGKDV